MQPAPTLSKTFRHPVVGDIAVDCDTLHLADCDQHLVLFSAPAESKAAETLAFLAAPGPDGGTVSGPR